MSDTEILESTDNAVMLDMAVRTGTVNVMQQRQWIRTMYSGASLCECKQTLQPGESASDTRQCSFLCLTTSGPVSVTFVDAENSEHTLTVNKALLLDSALSNITVSNEGSDAVVVAMTRLK